MQRTLHRSRALAAGLIVIGVSSVAGRADIRIGGWDADRGGSYGIAAGVVAVDARTGIDYSFTGVTFAGAGTLTPAFLADLDLLCISAVKEGGNVQIAPLSAAEQAALLSFVQSGGSAIVIGDNGVGFQGASESLFSPFGVHSQGLFNGIVPATVISPTAHAVSNGPFGLVTGFSVGFAAYFDDLGSSAGSLAVSFEEPVLAEINRNVLSAGAGKVLLASDAYLIDRVSEHAGEERLLLNAVADLTGAAPNHAWNVDADGNWSESTNWLRGVPDGATESARFGDVLNGARTVTLDSPRQVGTIDFDEPDGYTLAGPGTLTIAAASPARIKVLRGTQTIAAPIHFVGVTEVNVSDAAPKLRISGDMHASAGARLNKAGPGALEAKHVRINEVNLLEGRIAVTHSTAPNAPTGTSRVETLIIAGGATPSAELDLGNNAMVIDYTGASPLNGVRALIRAGYAAGSWTGNGIRSSAAAAEPGTTLGVLEASQIGSPTSFAGQPTDGTSVLIAYTLYGDSNLNGTVNIADFAQLASNFNLTTNDWFRGDYNYDGTTNIGDFSLLASNFNRTLAMNVPRGSAVPEPAGGLIVLAAASVARRRRAVWQGKLTN